MERNLQAPSKAQCPPLFATKNGGIATYNADPPTTKGAPYSVHKGRPESEHSGRGNCSGGRSDLETAGLAAGGALFVLRFTYIALVPNQPRITFIYL